MADDEYYTPMAVVEAELQHYDFSGMRVYCPCDAAWSAFPQYFKKNYKKLGLAGFARSSGDFRHYKAHALMSQCDVVVSNPPFSLFGVLVKQILSYDKKFLMLGSNWSAGLSYRWTMNEVVLGRSGLVVGPYIRPDGSEKEVPSYWYSNMDSGPPLRVRPSNGRKYHPDEYEFVDGDSGVLQVGAVRNIPSDYLGWMAVTPGYLQYHDPRRFELHPQQKYKYKLNGKALFERITIRRKFRRDSSDHVSKSSAEGIDQCRSIDITRLLREHQSP